MVVNRVTGRNKETFLKLVELVTPAIAKEDTVFRDAIPPHKRVAIALWRLAFVLSLLILMLESQHVLI